MGTLKDISNWKNLLFNQRKEAVSPVFSFLMATVIVSSTVGVIVFVGLPFIQELQEEEQIQKNEAQINSLVDKIEELGNGNSGDKIYVPTSLSDGKISMSDASFDRTIILYSFFEGFEFYVSSLDGADQTFYIHLVSPGGLTIERLWFYIDDSGDDTIDLDPAPYYEEILNPDFHPNPIITVNTELRDRIAIFLFDDDVTYSSPLIGVIWLFDSYSLDYSRKGIEYPELIIEKSGLLNKSTSGYQVDKMSIINVAENPTINSIIFKILQTLTSNSFSVASSGSSVFNINFANTGKATYEPIREVFNLRLQFFHGNAESWLKFFDEEYEYKDYFSRSSNTLSYDPSFSSGVWLALLHSVIYCEVT